MFNIYIQLLLVITLRNKIGPQCSRWPMHNVVLAVTKIKTKTNEITDIYDKVFLNGLLSAVKRTDMG